MSDTLKPYTIGQRIEIPVHYDAWMRGARFGTVAAYRDSTQGESAYMLVRLDHSGIRNRLKVWSLDWPYCKLA